MATWTDDIALALTNLGGIATLSDIYKEVKKIRPGPYPSKIDATIRGAIERSSSDSKAHSGKNDLFFSVSGLGAGIWGLRSINIATPVANDYDPLPGGSVQPERHTQTTYRILRETELARRIKILHKHQCQICSITLQLSGRMYSEAHHLQPLGKPHFGPDIPGNIVVVCPNCHVKLDYFSEYIDIKKFMARGGHVISAEYVNYHNSRVEGNSNSN